MTQENLKSSSIKDFIPQLQNFIKSETVFGEAYEVGDVTLIPVNSVKIGFGFGEGKGTPAGNGGGGGINLKPVAFIVIKNGNVTLHNLGGTPIENAIEKLPDFVEKMVDVVKKVKSGKDEE